MIRLEREQLIEHITNEILKRLDFSRFQESQASRSLVIVDESPFRKEMEISAQIREIHKKEGISEVVCINDDNCGSIIRDCCGISTIKSSALGSGIYRLLDRVENIYVLNFTVSNASRICMLSDNNTVCKAVQYSLLSGKKVFVSDLCSGFECTKVSKAYLDKIKSLSSQLGSFGITIMPEAGAANPVKGEKAAEPDKNDKARAAKKVICLEDLKDCSTGTLEIGSNSIITPLALEYIRDKKIRISTI